VNREGLPQARSALPFSAFVDVNEVPRQEAERRPERLVPDPLRLDPAARTRIHALRVGCVYPSLVGAAEL